MYERSTPQTGQTYQSARPDETSVSRSIQRRPRRFRRRKVVIALFCLLLVAVGGVGMFAGYGPFRLSASFQNAGKSGSTGVLSQQVVGHAYFESSGQISGYGSAGINDEVLLEISGIPAPASGTSYYAWLVGGSIEGKPVQLGQLSVKGGQGHLFYPGDGTHTNLLLSNNRFLITEEEAGAAPIVPSPNQSVWRYAFAFSQEPNKQESPPYSLLDHLHHLLSSDPELDRVGLQGGLNIWLFRDAQKLLEWAGSASSSWSKDPGLIHRQLVRIVQYLDGWRSALQELPPGTPLLVDQQISLAAMRELDIPDQEPPGLLYHIGQHLQGIAQAPGASQAQRELADRLNNDLNRVQGWLEQLHRDAVALVGLTPQQLAQPSALSLLDDLRTQALDAFSGRMVAQTNSWQAGVMQIYDEMPALATMDIVPVHCTSGREAAQQLALCL